MSALAMGTALGGSARLTYHEAFVAQGAREIIASGHWSYPLIGGRPWLEKPPLPFWLVALLGCCSGAIDPLVARLPSLVAGTLLVLGVGRLGARRHGNVVGLLAGAIQATTAWSVTRGRLAEADILLACLITWTLVAFDRLREPDPAPRWCRWRRWRWAFFTLLGLTSLVKGVGFGLVLVLSVVVSVLIWGRDRRTARRLWFPAGWLWATALTLAWPIAMVLEHGRPAIEIWLLHSVQRLRPGGGHGPFAGEGLLEYIPNVLGQGLPWTPLALAGFWLSLRPVRRAWRRGGWRNLEAPSQVRPQDHLLWAWTIIPLVLVSLPGTRNAHYAIHAMVPWSLWAARGLRHLARRRLGSRRESARPRLVMCGCFLGLAAAYGLCFWALGPRFDRRGREWAFYEQAGEQVPVNEPVLLLYDDWDRDPYPTPFGPIPHDAGVRLFYLNRPACWHFDVASILADEAGRCHGPATSGHGASLVILGRPRDLPALEAAGRVEVLRQGPPVRWDRTYLLARFWPGPGSRSGDVPGIAAATPFRR
ncbi:MAG: phospholipid carrier-dependent glycosyltransferase [Isosphaeraceae bacterium]